MRLTEFIICIILVIIGIIVLWDVYQSWKQGNAEETTVWVALIGTFVTVPALYNAARIVDSYFTNRM